MEWKTWGEFKQAVEAAGVKDDEAILWIDVGPSDEVHAVKFSDTGWEIS